MKQLIFISLLFVPFCLFGQADTTRLLTHLQQLTQTPDFRTHTNTTQLNATSSYIFATLQKHCDTSYYQEYQVNGKTYRNVIGEIGPKNSQIIVIGAHYDVCDNQPGADDNASGVAGMLELSRLLSTAPLTNKIQFVAYTLEEPPFFRTENMGSYVHAASLKASEKDVLGMVSLEMIGYFDDRKGTQDYPLNILKLVYGTKGNYITLVNQFSKGKFAKKLTRKFKRNASIRTKKFTGPSALPGIDFSDHLNYWKFGFSALMITDTAFYRNKNYHEATDTIDTLNFTKMGAVIDSLYTAITAL